MLCLISFAWSSPSCYQRDIIAKIMGGDRFNIKTNMAAVYMMTVQLLKKSNDVCKATEVPNFIFKEGWQISSFVRGNRNAFYGKNNLIIPYC